MPIGFRVSRKIPNSLVIGSQPLWSGSDKDADVTVDTDNRRWRSSAAGSVRSSTGYNTGKYYIEQTFTGTAGGTGILHGFATSGSSLATGPGYTSTSWGIDGNGTLYNNSSAGSDYATLSSSDVFCRYIDLDAGYIWYGVNGTPFAGNPGAGTSPMQTFTGGTTMYLCGGLRTAVSTRGGILTQIANYVYLPPSGFTLGWGP